MGHGVWAWGAGHVVWEAGGEGKHAACEMYARCMRDAATHPTPPLHLAYDCHTSCALLPCQQCTARRGEHRHLSPTSRRRVAHGWSHCRTHTRFHPNHARLRTWFLGAFEAGSVGPQLWCRQCRGLARLDLVMRYHWFHVGTSLGSLSWREWRGSYELRPLRRHAPCRFCFGVHGAWWFTTCYWLVNLSRLHRMATVYQYRTDCRLRERHVTVGSDTSVL